MHRMQGTVGFVCACALLAEACVGSLGTEDPVDAGLGNRPDASARDGGTSESDASTSADAGTYVDDTHLALQNYNTIDDLSQHAATYERYTWTKDSTGLDVRGGAFRVAISANDQDQVCNTGSLPTNRYPLSVSGGQSVAIVGGVMYSDISLTSDWQPLYCNSAAVHFKHGSPSGIVDGMRILGAWDAIRPSTSSPGLTVKNNWISNVRDDVVENDEYFTMEIRDNLVDGTFQGISIRDDSESGDFSSEVVTVSGNVIRVQDFLYKGAPKFGAFFKRVTDRAPTTRVYNTVVAVDSTTSSTFGPQWEHSWSSIVDCSHNLLLWLSDSSIPSGVHADKVPACFEIHAGAQARAMWQNAKQNWINCHPRLERITGDPPSDPSACTAGTFGGFTN